MPAPRPTLLHLLCAAWLVGVALGAPARGAQTARFSVQIDAPAPLRTLLETQLDLARWSGHERMTEDEIKRLFGLAGREIDALLETEGYYAAKVETRLDESADGAQVTLRVVPGDPVRVANVRLQVVGFLGADDAQAQNAREELIHAWRLEVGRVFRHADWEAAKRDWVQRLLVDRFALASIRSSEAVVNVERSAVDLHVVVDSGPPVVFGALLVEGLGRYPPSMVANLSPFREGAAYSYQRLQEFQSRLVDSGYFASVTVDAPAGADGVAPVRVTVQEREPRRIALGIGYSTDTGARVQGEYRQLNFRDRGWQLGSRLKLESRAQSARADLHFPVSSDGYQNRLMADGERTEVQGLDTRKIVLTAGRARRRGDIETDFTLAFVREQELVAGVGRDNRYALTANLSWTLRRTDHPLFPSDGYALNVQLGGAPGVFVAEQSFVRTYAKAVAYRRLGADGVLSARLELGGVAARGTGDVPSDYLFRTGGDRTVRGYAFQSLGVRRGEAVTGGRALAVASLEYTRWVTRDWGTAVFLDAGNATDGFGGFRFARGYGIGARWRSPVGPLNLDLAHGADEGKFRLHFSVGIAF